MATLGGLNFAEMNMWTFNFKMNQAQAYPAPQVYPQPGMKPAGMSVEPEPEKQCCGYTLAVLGIILGILGGIGQISTGALTVGLSGVERAGYAIAGVGMLIEAVFFILIVSKPDYLGGQPAFVKLVPFIIAMLFIHAGSGILSIGSLLGALSALISTPISTALAYFMYLGDDDSGSCCLCFKPWIMKRPTVVMYPPQYGYPPQGYPPQQQAYPPQHHQQQAYPPQQPQQQA